MCWSLLRGPLTLNLSCLKNNSMKCLMASQERPLLDIPAPYNRLEPFSARWPLTPPPPFSLCFPSTLCFLRFLCVFLKLTIRRVGATSMVVFVCDLCALFLSGKRKWLLFFFFLNDYDLLWASTRWRFLKGKTYLLKSGIFVYRTVVFFYSWN